MEFSLCCRREPGKSDDKFTAWLGFLVITPPPHLRKRKKKKKKKTESHL